MTTENESQAPPSPGVPSFGQLLPTDLSRRLGPEDAAFLFLESDQSPLNVGSAAIFEGKIPYDRFVESVEAKMHLVPRYRQRVVRVPFDAARPTWEDDPLFDVRRHVFRVQLDAPGSDQDLLDLAARIHEGTMDRGKPLWEIYLVEGLQGDRTGMIFKVHHCLVDGIAGIALLMVTMDFSPDAPAPEPPESAYVPEPIPSWTGLLRDAVFDGASELVDRWAEFQNSLLDLASGDRSRLESLTNAVKLAVPYLSRSAEKLPMNQEPTGRRRLVATEMSFKEVREIRKAVCGTVNDVVLATLGGALGRYIKAQGESVAGRSIRVATPVNVRPEGEAGLLGNRISIIVVEVPVGIYDPVARLKEIASRTSLLKQSRAAEGIQSIGESLLSLPAPLIAGLGKTGASPGMIANLVCTNVPGPMIPLYSVGHRMLCHFPMAPILWNMGINVAVTSYNGMLYFGCLADSSAAKDVDLLRDCLELSYSELREAAGVGLHPPLEIRRGSEVATPDKEAVARTA